MGGAKGVVCKSYFFIIGNIKITSLVSGVGSEGVCYGVAVAGGEGRGGGFSRTPHRLKIHFHGNCSISLINVVHGI